MLRAPSDPPELRKRSEIDPPAPFFAVEIEFDLIALSAG